MKTEEGQSPGFMPLPEAAAWVGVSQRTVKRWFGKGLTYYQSGPGTKVLIRPCDIETFLTKRQAQKTGLDVMVNEILADLKKKAQYQGKEFYRLKQTSRQNVYTIFLRLGILPL